MTEWRNRIVESGEESPDQLLANPMNFRRHPKHQQDALRGVLNEVGWVQDVIVNRTTGRLVDGHLRVELALRDEAATVPVKYVDLSEAEEALILATFDPISALAFADREQLDALLREVSTGEAAVQQMLADLAEREGIVQADGFLADALAAGDGKSAWPDTETELGEDENSMTLRVTPTQRTVIMRAVAEAKAADDQLESTPAALAAICERYLCLRES